MNSSGHGAELSRRLPLTYMSPVTHNIRVIVAIVIALMICGLVIFVFHSQGEWLR
jgi:hypothetical protein